LSGKSAAPALPASATAADARMSEIVLVVIYCLLLCLWC
jgi:hypothetical protein